MTFVLAVCVWIDYNLVSNKATFSSGPGNKELETSVFLKNLFLLYANSWLSSIMLKTIGKDKKQAPFENNTIPNNIQATSIVKKHFNVEQFLQKSYLHTPAVYFDVQQSK